MPTLGVGSELIRLSVANLQLVLDARGTGMRMAVPAAHASFLVDATDGGLALSVREGRLRQGPAWRALCAPPETWQLWQDERGRYVFVAGQHSPPARQVTVDAGFRCGEVLGQFGSYSGPAESVYPLRNIDIILFANWLAESGDLILHAAGVQAGERGYCFAGTSGAGKSTLAASLLSTWREAAETATTNGGTVEVLGEDNLVLRCLEGRFWIYGTPWHQDPAMCSPLGVPLEKLFFLDRTAAAGVESVGPVEGVARLLQSAFVPYYRPEAVSGILERLALLAQQVPFYTLSYQLGADVLKLIREA